MKTLRRSGIALAATLVSWALSGCGGEEILEPAGMMVPENDLDLALGKPDYHSWRKIYSVESRGKDVQRKHVGFLDHWFTDADPDGRFIVRDLKFDKKGFLLPGGTAFLFEVKDGIVSSRNLDNTGLEGGIKKILQVPGEIQLGDLAEPPPGAVEARGVPAGVREKASKPTAQPAEGASRASDEANGTPPPPGEK